MALGIVLTPFGRNPDGTSPPFAVNYAGVNRFGELCPSDPQFNTSGEQGMYYDTPLGGVGDTLRTKIARWKAKAQLKRMQRGLRDIPTDAELATNYGYTPVQSGWINTTQGQYVTGPWLPPDGRNYGGAPVPVALSGLRDGAPAATVDDVVMQMNAHNDRVFALTLVSTAAVAVSAMIAIFRSVKLIHEGK